MESTSPEIDLEAGEERETERRHPADEEWVKKLKDRRSVLDVEEQERSRKANHVIYKVDPQWRESHDESYNPEIVSLGLYHRQNADRSSPLGQTFKIDMVLNFLEFIRKTPEDWRSVSADVVPNPLEMKRQYDGHWSFHFQEESYIRSCLAEDAIFLASIYCAHRFSPKIKLKRRGTMLFDFVESLDRGLFHAILRDALMLENQIPLELVRNAIAVMVQSQNRYANLQACLSEADEKLEVICASVVEIWRVQFPSFVDPVPERKPLKLHACHHMLHCLAQSLWDGAKAERTPKAGWMARQVKHFESISSRWSTNWMRRQLKKLEQICSRWRASWRKRQSKKPDANNSGSSGQRPEDHTHGVSMSKSKSKSKPKSKPTSRWRSGGNVGLSLTASQLRNHGIDFRGQDEFWPRFEQHSFFWWKATLFLPRLQTIYDPTPTRWRNFLAFESLYQFKRKGRRPFMAYLLLLDSLVNTEEDVSVLSSGKDPVIEINRLGDNKLVADLFNSVTRNHVIQRFVEITWVVDKINAYLNTPSRHFWSALHVTLSHRPWLPIPIFAAFAVLVLSLLQTVYTIKSYQISTQSP